MNDKRNAKRYRALLAMKDDLSAEALTELALLERYLASGGSRAHPDGFLAFQVSASLQPAERTTDAGTDTGHTSSGQPHGDTK